MESNRKSPMCFLFHGHHHQLWHPSWLGRWSRDECEHMSTVEHTVVLSTSQYSIVQRTRQSYNLRQGSWFRSCRHYPCSECQSFLRDLWQRVETCFQPLSWTSEAPPHRGFWIYFCAIPSIVIFPLHNFISISSIRNNCPLLKLERRLCSASIVENLC